ncbi:MAG: amidohydrolase, partial [Gammaproteobacteria bacterium]|nr:amidohydrolase [Gammaproteobacteria bacterium]
MKWTTALLATVLLAAANGQADTLFINDATVHPMGLRPVMQNADILVRDGKVHSLGAELEAPLDAVVIEAAGRPVTPGLFAGITAHGLAEISMVQGSVDGQLNSADTMNMVGMHPEFDVTTAYNPMASTIPIT